MSTDPNTIEKHVAAEVLAAMPEAERTAQALQTTDYRAVHAAQLEEIAQRVEALPAITDRKTYDQNQAMRTALVKIRTGIDARRKALFEPMRRLKGEVDAYLGTGKDSGLQARIAVMESAIASKQEAWDNEQERKRQEAQRIIDDRNRARGQALMRMGYGFDGTHYHVGRAGSPLYDVVSASDVNMMNEERWALVLKQCEAKAEAIRVELLAEQRWADLVAAGATEDPSTGHLHYHLHGADKPWTWTREELGSYDATDFSDELATVKDDVRQRRIRQEAEAKRLREDQQRLDEERAAMKAEKQAMRHERLMGIGVQQAPEGFYFVPMGDTLTDRRWECVSDLAGLSDEDWQYAIGAAGRAVTDRKAELAAIQAEDAARADAGEFIEEEEPSVELMTQRDDDADDDAAEYAMAASSGIYEHPDETLVRETEELLAAKKADARRLDAVLTTLLAARDEVSAFRSAVTGSNETLLLAEVEGKVAEAVKLVREYLIQKGS